MYKSNKINNNLLTT